MASGDLLGDRYELGEIIGRGGMSTVHRSYDHRMHRAVAVKVFQPGVDLTDADERYRREVMLLAALRDPGLVTVLDADLGGEGSVEPAYLVTELVDGPTLAQRLKESPLTEPDVVRLGATLGRTLAYVHGHGIVHRDVKPANILLAPSADSTLGLPKLVDFGIAITADSARLTAADLMLGTANYLSPEQLRGATLTPVSDIYSLGLVLTEALTGKPSYPGTGLAAAMARLDHPPVIPDTASPPLRDLLAEMTAADPADRPTAEQVAGRLDALLVSEVEIADAATVVGPAALVAASVAQSVRPVEAEGVAVQRPPRSHWWPHPHMLTAIGGIVVAALFGMGVLASLATHKPPAPPASSDVAPPPAPPTNHPKPHRPPTPQARLAPSAAPNGPTGAAVAPRTGTSSAPPSPTKSSPTPSHSTPARSTPAPPTTPGTSPAPTAAPTSTPAPTPTATPTSSAPPSPPPTPPSSPPTPSPLSWQAL